MIFFRSKEFTCHHWWRGAMFLAQSLMPYILLCYSYTLFFPIYCLRPKELHLQSWTKVLRTVMQYSYLSVISGFPYKNVHSFRNFLAVLPLPAYNKVETRKKSWIHASNFVAPARFLSNFFQSAFPTTLEPETCFLYCYSHMWTADVIFITNFALANRLE